MEMGEWAIMLPIFILMTIISYYYYSKWFLDEEGWFGDDKVLPQHRAGPAG